MFFVILFPCQLNNVITLLGEITDRLFLEFGQLHVSNAPSQSIFVFILFYILPRITVWLQALKASDKRKFAEVGIHESCIAIVHLICKHHFFSVIYLHFSFFCGLEVKPFPIFGFVEARRLIGYCIILNFWLCSIKRLGVLFLPLHGMLVHHNNTAGWREVLRELKVLPRSTKL